MTKEKTIEILKEADIVLARKEARDIAKKMGFSVVDQCRIATAISELTRNIIRFTPKGKVTIKNISAGKLKGIEIVCSDEGPGIPDIELAMQDGYTTADGLGAGLPGTKRLMDEFKITSKKNKGTTVIVKKWNK